MPPSSAHVCASTQSFFGSTAEKQLHFRLLKLGGVGGAIQQLTSCSAGVCFTTMAAQCHHFRLLAPTVGGTVHEPARARLSAVLTRPIADTFESKTNKFLTHVRAFWQLMYRSYRRICFGKFSFFTTICLHLEDIFPDYFIDSKSKIKH